MYVNSGLLPAKSDDSRENFPNNPSIFLIVNQLLTGRADLFWSISMTMCIRKGEEWPLFL